MTLTRVDRCAQIQGWMDAFVRVYPEVRFFEIINDVNAVALINETYWEKMLGSIKTHMANGTDGYADRHKVASLYEAVIAQLNPILPQDGTEEGPINPLNQVFAYFVAISVIDTFNRERGLRLDYFVSESFDREHKALLSICQVTDSFVFANAATWYLVEKIAIDKLAG